MSRASTMRITDPAGFGRVAVLFGGDSAEREISLMSGTAVHEALLRHGVNAVAVDPADGLVDQLQAGGFDRAWIALHGRGGEDGSVQGLLSVIGLPYTGSRTLGSALCMDKLRSKQLLAGCGLPTPAYVQMYSVDDCDAVIDRLGLPVMVKPAEEGSSIGLTKVETAAELPAAWRQAAGCGCAVFAEQWIHGAEYSASLLGGEVLPLIRIDADNSFYDYEAKYFSDRTRYVCPCELPAEQEQQLGQLAAAAFDALGASGWGRVDLMLDEQGSPLILEVNTVPGMTSHSLVPLAAAQAGIGFDELVWRILETSFTEVGDGCAA